MDRPPHPGRAVIANTKQWNQRVIPILEKVDACEPLPESAPIWEQLERVCHVCSWMASVELIRKLFFPRIHLIFSWSDCEPFAEIDFSFETNGLTFT